MSNDIYVFQIVSPGTKDSMIIKTEKVLLEDVTGLCLTADELEASYDWLDVDGVCSYKIHIEKWERHFAQLRLELNAMLEKGGRTKSIPFHMPVDYDIDEKDLNAALRQEIRMTHYTIRAGRFMFYKSTPNRKKSELYYLKEYTSWLIIALEASTQLDHKVYYLNKKENVFNLIRLCNRLGITIEDVEKRYNANSNKAAFNCDFEEIKAILKTNCLS